MTAEPTFSPLSRSELLDLIEDLTNPYPCCLDRHGYCQEHTWMTTVSPCADGRAQAVLEAERPIDRKDNP